MFEGLFDLGRALFATFGDGGPFVTVIVCVFGLVFGSFLAVIVFRLPVMLHRRSPDQWPAPPADFRGLPETTFNLVAPRSRCLHCGHRISWYENIPVLSYFLLRFRCSACHRRISPRYPIIELCAGIAALTALFHFGGEVRMIGAMALSFALITVAFIDMENLFIPDAVVLPVMWLGLLSNAFDMFVPLRDAVFGAVAGYLALWSIYWLHRTVSGKEGLGHGDFKLLAMLGAWLGLGAIPLILLLAFAAGAAFGLGLMILRRARMASALPFGPFLAGAGWITLHWEHALTGFYWDWMLSWY